MTYRPIMFLIVLLPLVSCSGEQRQAGNSVDTGRIHKYAAGFHIESYNDYRILHVKDPWQGSEGIHYRKNAKLNTLHLPNFQHKIK